MLKKGVTCKQRFYGVADPMDSKPRILKIDLPSMYQASLLLFHQR